MTHTCVHEFGSGQCLVCGGWPQETQDGYGDIFFHEGSVVPKTDWRTKRVLGRPWQDLLFSIGEAVFLVSLGPLLFTDANIPLFTGLATAAMLYSFAAAQASYRNWITLTLTSLTATIWLLLGLGIHF